MAASGPTVALALALMLGAAGASCGGAQAPRGPTAEVERALADAQQAFADGDRAAACAALTATAQRQVGAAGHGPPKPCVANMGMFMQAVRKTGASDAAGAPTVEAVDLRDAVATIRFAHGVERRVPIAREDGRWKLGEFFGFSPRSRLSR